MNSSTYTIKSGDRKERPGENDYSREERKKSSVALLLTPCTWAPIMRALEGLDP